MANESIVWSENISNSVKCWVMDFFSAADTKGEESARKFSDSFSEDAYQQGMGGPLNGRQEIHESRLHVWDSVESRKHIIHKVYALDKSSNDILILGKLESKLINGNSFEMEFAAQAIFEDSSLHAPKCRSYKVWADKRIAIEAAKAQ